MKNCVTNSSNTRKCRLRRNERNLKRLNKKGSREKVCKPRKQKSSGKNVLRCWNAKLRLQARNRNLNLVMNVLRNQTLKIPAKTAKVVINLWK